MVLLLLIGFFTLVIFRCVSLHLVSDPRLEKIAKNQYRAVIPHVSPRGTIYDAKGDELAVSVPTVSLAARPPLVAEPGRLATELSRILSLPRKEILKDLQSDKKYVWIKRQLSRSESIKLRQLDDPGLERVLESRRFYPNEKLASQILGAVGVDGQGLGGMEYGYDEVLRALERSDVAFRDARGERFALSGFSDESRDETHDLWLTVNKQIQFAVETELEKACRENSAKSCTGIVMDPLSGAILAMASYPSFNPNEFRKYDWSLWKNRAVTDGFEPGSIFKVILAAAALEAGTVSPEDRFFCENGTYRVGNHTLNDSHAHGLLTFRQILKVSSNIGVFKIGKRIGKEKFASVIERFGFGRTTGVDFPGEANGRVQPVSSWREIDFANMTFGHGIQVTPIQMLRAIGIIAAGGRDVQPHFVARVARSDGTTVWRPGSRKSRIIEESTARTLAQMMSGTTEEGGTGTLAQIPGYAIAGKTGTAQKVKNGRYSHEDFVSSFVGFAPAESPRVSLLVIIDEPRGKYYGGDIAAPVFRRIAWTTLRELGVPPRDRNSLSPRVVHAALSSFGLGSSRGGSGESLPEGVPNFQGMSMREVLNVLEDKKITAELTGSGRVVSQDCLPGAPVQQGEICRITFQNLPY